MIDLLVVIKGCYLLVVDWKPLQWQLIVQLLFIIFWTGVSVSSSSLIELNSGLIPYSKMKFFGRILSLLLIVSVVESIY